MDQEAKYWRDKWLEALKVIEALRNIKFVQTVEPKVKKRRKENG